MQKHNPVQKRGLYSKRICQISKNPIKSSHHNTGGSIIQIFLKSLIAIRIFKSLCIMFHTSRFPIYPVKRKLFGVRIVLLKVAVAIVFFLLQNCNTKNSNNNIEELKAGFLNPPEDTRPGVYWYFMDGNLSKEGMTADLESMKQAGIGTVLFLEVNVGVPRGKVDFFSEEWKDLFVHAVHECERLGIEMTLGVGPGWTGSGGPWVKPSQSMQHLVSSSIEADGAEKKQIRLPVPLPRSPFFGEGGFTPGLKKQWEDFYEDVAVLAFPSPDTNAIPDIGEKALYYRAPYTSQPGVKQYLPSLASYPVLPPTAGIKKNTIIDLSGKLNADGTLNWEVPTGKWTIMRFGRRNNGAVTRPAPLPGLGFECDKFDTVAFNDHLNDFTGKLLDKIGTRNKSSKRGLTMLHMDSWEMGSQNWTPAFRNEFTKRRGYDPLPFYPVYAGKIVESLEISERFLWDLRQTSQELVVEYHAQHLKSYSHRNGFGLSIEPYDMNPSADMELGSVADVPMCEFWSPGGFNSAFSCIQAASIAHVNGQPVVAAESFTAVDGWKQHPGSMKNQGDWAFATGINKFVYHTFQHQPLDKKLKPGMTMGPYGVQWNRNQTWWPMADAYHKYISRCQYLLRQGRSVADVLYLTPEGSPHVFRAPASALSADPFLPDRKGYNFDGCSPGQLYNAYVKNNKVTFPGGASYHLLVLPAFETMTPALLKKIKSLITEGATIIGTPPQKSPGLSGYPGCDAEIKSLAKEIWGSADLPLKQVSQNYGKGKIIRGGEISTKTDNLYPEYAATAGLLKEMGIQQDFEADSSIRYIHRELDNADLYFVSNKTDKLLKAEAIFRSAKNPPSLWDPLTGEIYSLPEFSKKGDRTSISLQFEPYQSFFIVFAKDNKALPAPSKNFPVTNVLTTIQGAWNISFDTTWGGPATISFDNLEDWTLRHEQGIKYYSGIAVYKKTFDVALNTKPGNDEKFFLDLGEVKNMARVTLNGKLIGVVWTAPWKLDISDVLKEKDNKLEIEVANLWPNRLIGDEQLPADGIKDGEWPEWLLNNKSRTSGRYTFSTHQHYDKNSPLLKSGLIGPVTIQQSHF